MVTKEEVEQKIAGMSDFLKMEYLEEISKRTMDINVKKFAHQKIAQLYADKGMYSTAARHLEAWADMCITFKEKTEAFVQETEMWIKTEDYITADNIMKKALGQITNREKEDVKMRIKNYYKQTADKYDKTNQRNKALKVYEKLYSIETDASEKEVLRQKLLYYYDKLGKIREFMMLRDKN